MERMRSTIRWYLMLAGTVFAIACIAIVLVNWPSGPLVRWADKTQGNLVSVFFAALAGLPLKDVQDRKNKILLLSLLVEEFSSVSVLRDPAAVDRLEQRCQQLVDKILGG
jgi:hypothetical protein